MCIRDSYEAALACPVNAVERAFLEQARDALPSAQG